MPGRLGQQLVVWMRGRGQRLLHPAEVVEHFRLEGGVRKVNGNCADQLLSTSSAHAYTSNFRVCPFRTVPTKPGHPRPGGPRGAEPPAGEGRGEASVLGPGGGGGVPRGW